ncbi:hypothetical protein ACMGD3_22670 [Lysinibacillus sphaericus]|uniref:hypothetical protein n=1 Tax=Lysinibacillus sphaericus TaxID=1421 RepID=UPI003F798917
MRKTSKKTWMIASALTIGMAVLTPLQAGAASAEKTIEASVQKEQQIKGTVKSIYMNGINLKGKDGKNYFISFNKFSTEQLEKMNLVEGQEIAVEGSVVENYNDFNTFEVYKKDLPKEVTNKDLVTLEKMFNDMKKIEKDINAGDYSVEVIKKKLEEMDNIYDEMYKIKKPYVLANKSFDEYIEDYGFNESNIVINENDKKQLKAIYEEWVKLEKNGDEEKANEKYDEFDKILQPYFDELYPPQTFEETLDGLESEIPAETLAKLKTIFGDAQKADKDDNEELSNKLWNEFYEILDQFHKTSTFEEYMADFDFEVSEADSKQLKQLYEESLALDKKEELEKAEEKWDAFHKILDPYRTANEKILIFASKLTIDGQDYFPQH